MNKSLMNVPVLLCVVLSLGATGVITAWVLAGGMDRGPTMLMDEPMKVPAFEVTDQNGQTMTRQSMLGRVWVCDFFLSRCTAICPILGQTMADLTDRLSENPALDQVQLVSFSVDPEHDTVEQLNLYRQINMGIWAGDDEALREQIEARWFHTRAEDQNAFWALVRDGFKLYVGPSVNDPTTPVAHSGKLVLIDREGQIRGYYNGLTDEDIPALMADIERLVEEPR